MDCEKTSLHQAVRSGDIRLVNEVLQRDPSSVYDRNSAYETPLHLAYNHVNHKKPEQPNNGLPILKLLVDHGADVNALGGGMFASALHMAVARKQVDGVKFLLESRADPNIIDENNCTAMHLAVDESSEDIIQVLLDYKADPNIIDCNGLSPLDRAITSCNKNCATKLLESGAKSNNIYKTLLEICIKHSEQPDSLKYKSFIEHILAYAGKLDVHFSLKAIMYYAESKNHDQYHKDEKKCFFSEFVHKQGTNEKDAISESELHLAVRGGEDAKIEALLQEGADVNVKNLFGETPLHLLLKNGISYFSFDSERFNKTAYLLIERGSNLRARNYMNETPFFLAVCDEMTNKKIVNLMLAKMTGLDEKTLIDPYLRRGSGLYISCDVKKPELHELIIASERGYEKVIDRLLDMDRIDEASKNSQAATRILNVATYRGSYSIIKMLLEAGFRTNRIYNLDVLDFFGFKIPMSTESLSLFWEFKENVTLDGAMICAFCYVNGYEKRVIQSTRLLIFYFAIYLRLNKLSKDLIPATELFKLDDVLSKELDNCNKVLDRLKRVKAGTISIFDMMTMSLDSFVQMLNNKKHLEACVKFRSSLAQKNKGILNYYDYAVKVRIDLAVEKRKVLDGAYYYFNEALQLVLGTMYFESLPDEIVWNILSYLNVRELKKLANIDTLTS